MWRSRDTATAALLGLGDVFTGLGWPGSAHVDYGKILALMRRDSKDCSRDVPQE
jgi:hypothetical protein